jgi:hypothetical protein
MKRSVAALTARLDKVLLSMKAGPCSAARKA